jgi:hypothetical protein
VIDQDQSDHPPQRSPQQIQRLVAQRDPVLAADGAGGADEPFVAGEQIAQLDLGAIALGATAAVGGDAFGVVVEAGAGGLITRLWDSRWQLPEAGAA